MSTDETDPELQARLDEVSRRLHVVQAELAGLQATTRGLSAEDVGSTDLAEALWHLGRDRSAGEGLAPEQRVEGAREPAEHHPVFGGRGTA